MLCLVMRRGPTPGAVYDLESDEITIGRGSKNNIVIRDNEVSREHCRLVRLSSNYEVHDLNSSNGTFVNGQRVVTPWLLQPGVLIELGDTITLEYGPPAVDNTQPASEEMVVAAEDGHYSLTLLKGPGAGSSYPLEGEAITVGRDISNDIVIQDPEVSRHHLRLFAARGGYHAEDLNSTNGTFINSETLKQARCLEPNDVITLGTAVQLRYGFGDALAEADEDETPVVHPVDVDYSKDDTLNNIFDLEPNRRAAAARSTGLEPGALREHLMIVYAREDWESVVAPLLDRLQDTRLTAWVDQYLALGGDDWRMAVEQALTECWLMILVVSPEALSSAYVQLMYRYFLKEGKPIIPLIQDAVQPLPGDLNRLRALVYDPENNPRSFHKLIFEIMQLHQQR